MNRKSNMVTNRFSIAISLLFALVFFNQVKSQGVSNQGIILNEYSASNGGTPLDSYGSASDWVEITTTQSPSVTLAGYFLSNDKFNLFKWKFPSNFTITANGYRIVWLTGKNLVTPAGEVHANFDLTQCKSQWLILSTSNGVIRDSIFVQKTQLGHSRVRMDNSLVGIAGWRVATANTFSLANPPLAFTFRGYLPTPVFECPAGISTSTFCNTTGDIRIKLNGLIADSIRDCIGVHYTINGSCPTPSDPIYDSVATGPILNNLTPSGTSAALTKIIRAVAYPSSTASCLPDLYLPSFCETNTYFFDPEYALFKQEFGIVSIAIDPAVATSWFISGGSAPLIPPCTHVEYFDKGQVTEGYMKMWRPQQETWRTAQQGFYMTMDDRMGFGCDFASNPPYPIFNVDGLGASTRSAFPTLHLKGGDFESNSTVLIPPTTSITGTGLRDVFYQSLAAKNNLNVNPLHIKPVITFINGIYQGVYDLREIFDKHYEAFYNGQARDSVDMNINYDNIESTATNGDGTPHAQFSPITAWRGVNSSVGVYDFVLSNAMVNITNYNRLLSRIDKESFIDYFVLGTYATNNDFWKNNVAFARGNQIGKPGTKWHYYLWNMPTIFSYTSIGNSTNDPIAASFVNFSAFPCSNMYSSNQLSGGTTTTTTPNIYAFNGHGNIMWRLFQPSTGNKSFQLEYLNRYQDLLNGPLRCDNILKHFDYVYKLYEKEMRYHEDPAAVPSPGSFSLTGVNVVGNWDTNMVNLRKIIAFRCDYMINGLKKCYPLQGPFGITVDVEPVGAGSVKLNTMVLPYYKWIGSYFPTTLSFKAIPTNTTYVFDHWEFKVHQPLNSAPLSKDSVAIGFTQSGQNSEEVIAVFTDKSSDITQNGENANMPSAFSPNNDNVNEIYKPLGSAVFAKEYDFRIYNRWGQEVFRTTDPVTGWDGIFNGQPAQTGVYAWIITYKNIYNEAKLAKGNVTLVR